MKVVRTGTFLYFVDELRLVRHTRRPEESQVANLDYSVPSDDVIEALPESVCPSPTSVCSATESAGQKMLRIDISA